MVEPRSRAPGGRLRSRLGAAAVLLLVFVACPSPLPALAVTVLAARAELPCRVGPPGEVACAPCCRRLPSLVGLGVEEALSCLRRWGADGQPVDRPLVGPRGRVAATNPHAGGAVCPGQRVTLYVSSGTAPALEGMSLGAARIAAHAAGVTLDVPGERCGAGDDDLVVERQWPRAGEPLMRRDQAVEVMLRPRYALPLTLLEGLDADAARRTLCALGWRGHWVCVGDRCLMACSDRAQSIDGEVIAASLDAPLHTRTTAAEDCRIGLSISRTNVVQVPVPTPVEAPAVISAEATIGTAIALLTLWWLWPRPADDASARRQRGDARRRG